MTTGISKEKQLEVMFPLHTTKGVIAFLKNKHHIEELRYYDGDYDACNLLIDYEIALKDARLTARQKEILYYVYELDMSLTETGDMLGIRKQSVKRIVEQGVKRLTKYYAAIIEGGEDID